MYKATLDTRVIITHLVNHTFSEVLGHEEGYIAITGWGHGLW